MNVPLPAYAGHDAVTSVFDDIVLPAARRFAPNLMIVSSGYDAHVADPFQLLQYRSSTYHWMASKIRQLAQEMCNGRLVFLLEGGYNTEALGESVAETWRALLQEGSQEGKKVMEMPQVEPLEQVQDLIKKLKQIHKIS